MKFIVGLLFFSFIYSASADPADYGMSFFGNGCCRFDDYSSQSHGYKTIDACMDKCNQDYTCIAADVANPNDENEYDCYTFAGEGKNFKTKCDKNKNTCYKKASCTDDSECAAGQGCYIYPDVSAGVCLTCNGVPHTFFGCCSSSNPCDVGEGDCKSDSDCAGELVCGTRNCESDFSSSYTNWHYTADCCRKACSVDGSNGDGTKQGTCPNGYVCKSNGRCKAGDESYGGYCRYGLYDSKSDYIGKVSTNSVSDCRQECLDTNGCTAISYGGSNGDCHRYRGGPYTYGSNMRDYTCFVIQVWIAAQTIVTQPT